MDSYDMSNMMHLLDSFKWLRCDVHVQKHAQGACSLYLVNVVNLAKMRANQL